MNLILITATAWLLGLFSPISIMAQSETSLSVAAQFVRFLTVPGTENHLLRPGRILIEANTNEIYVADPGNSRVTIFDSKGIFLYEFSTVDQCGAPTDLAVDSQGYIYVLGTTLEGPKIFIYDFDGKFIKAFNPALPDGQKINAGSLAISERDKLYVLDLSGPRLLGFDINGNLESEIKIEGEMDEALREELFFGSLFIKNDVIYLPAASLGKIIRFNISGEKVPSLGYKGSGVGELGFPVSVGVSDDGIIAVLNKHRYNVVCFSESGQFLGEFGGKGMRAGWFYHPTWLAIGPEDEIYIGQTYNNMVQVCRLPQFIVDRHLQIHSNNSNREVDPQLATGGQKIHLEPDPELSDGTAMEPGTQQHLFFSSHSVHRQDLDLPGINSNALKEVH